jgi:FkbM family methyltransferase
LQVPDRGAWSSAGEVFLSRLYDPFFRHLHDVRHWVDLGCNNGFFSFGLLDHLTTNGKTAPETRAFLADANQICATRVQAAIDLNALSSRWRCRQLVIGPPGTTVSFQQHKDSLHSNIFGHGRSRHFIRYPTTDISAMLATESQLFDLIKIDIEGAERFLFEDHLPFLKRFRFGLCEWHVPDFPGEKLHEHIQRLGWRVLELRSQGVKFDRSHGESWDSPLGMVLWENPAPTH